MLVEPAWMQLVRVFDIFFEVVLTNILWTMVVGFPTSALADEQRISPRKASVLTVSGERRTEDTISTEAHRLECNDCTLTPRPCS